MRGLSRTFTLTKCRFAYFRDVIDEVQNPEIPSGYWTYIVPELDHLEKKWIEEEKKWIEEKAKGAGANAATASRPKSRETR
ncbi:hypothetical protein GCM10011586_28990 [Silvibacterium dinghuense]|nr:hypothetical protein GCM10011586_28990 [Silvibacterium dinghuense]